MPWSDAVRCPLLARIPLARDRIGHGSAAVADDDRRPGLGSPSDRSALIRSPRDPEGGRPATVCPSHDRPQTDHPTGWTAPVGKPDGRRICFVPLTTRLRVVHEPRTVTLTAEASRDGRIHPETLGRRRQRGAPMRSTERIEVSRLPGQADSVDVPGNSHRASRPLKRSEARIHCENPVRDPIPCPAGLNKRSTRRRDDQRTSGGADRSTNRQAGSCADSGKQGA